MKNTKICGDFHEEKISLKIQHPHPLAHLRTSSKMIKAASFAEEASAIQAAATEEAATQEAIAPPKEADAQAEAITADSKEADASEEAVTKEAAAIQGAVAQVAQVAQDALMQVDAQAEAMAATSQAGVTEEATATLGAAGNQALCASHLAAGAKFEQLLQEEVENENHYDPDAPGADTLLAEDEYPGEPPVIQETCLSNILPTKPKGSHMKTCWILVPLLHIHDESRHGSILHHITSSLKATIRKLDYVGVEKVKVKQGASGIAHSYWLILVKPGT
jgi:hypothetical protein